MAAPRHRRWKSEYVNPRWAGSVTSAVLRTDLNTLRTSESLLHDGRTDGCSQVSGLKSALRVMTKHRLLGCTYERIDCLSSET